MQTEQILLKDFETIVKFVKIVNKYNTTVKVISALGELDAKSMLGLFGLNPEKPVSVATPEVEFPESLREELKCFKC